MGGSSRVRQDQTSYTTMPALQQQNANVLLTDALKQYETGGPKYYEGNTVAQADPNQTAARSAATSYATGAGADQIKQAQGANNYWLSPDVLMNYSKTPGYDATRQGIYDDATKNLTNNVLPTIRSDSIMNGQYGGTSQQIGEALATSETNKGIASSLGQLDLGIYGQNINAQQNAIARAPAMYDLGLAPSQTLENVGASNRADEQQNIDADMQRWNFDQLRPLLNLQALQSLTGTAGQYGGTSRSVGSQEMDPNSDGQMSQILGAIIMAFAMGA